MLGIIAENATETLRKNPEEFVDAGLKIGAAPYLGPVLMDANGTIQWINEQHLLSSNLRELLFITPPHLEMAAFDQAAESNQPG